MAAPGTGRAVSPELCVERGLGEEERGGGGADGGPGLWREPRGAGGQWRLTEEVGAGGRSGRSEGKVCVRGARVAGGRRGRCVWGGGGVEGRGG